MSALNEIADRAIDYTNTLVHKMPSYRIAAIASLRKLRDSLARQTPDDPAVQRLSEYLQSLDVDKSQV